MKLIIYFSHTSIPWKVTLLIGRDKELSKVKEALLVGRDLKLSKFKHGIVDG